MRITHGLRVRSGNVVALVGGGGKTTVMFRLAEELTSAGLTVITTMTAKIFVAQMARAPHSLLLEEDNAVPHGLAAMLAEHRHVLIGGRIGADREKVEGVLPEFVDRLAAAKMADVMIVEADGSRRLPFKAPAEHEPVVPSSTTVFVSLVGLDVLGQPLDADHVHRAQLVAELAAARLGEPVTASMIARVLADPRGGAKGVPSRARLVAFLNKADLSMEGGRELGRLLVASPGIDEVVLGAAETTAPVRETWGRVAAVVLAAGEARRFGGLKQVMPWHGVPLVTHVVRQALACDDIAHTVVTSGAQAQLVEDALREHRQTVTLVSVAEWAKGQSRSVRAGLAAAENLSNGRLAAALFLLADQPGVTPALLSALVRRHRETLAPVVAPRHQGKRGNPVLFDRRTFVEFDDLDGDSGARRIIQRHEEEIAWVDWPTDEILKDIDTPQDYAAARESS